MELTILFRCFSYGMFLITGCTDQVDLEAGTRDRVVDVCVRYCGTDEI